MKIFNRIENSDQTPAVFETWVNDEYEVMINRNSRHGFGNIKVTHLAIRRLDNKPIHDWCDLQAIKNMMTNAEYEAIELYPAQSRLMDAANQYHLWVPTNIDGSSIRIPVGHFAPTEISSPNHRMVYIKKPSTL